MGGYIVVMIDRHAHARIINNGIITINTTAPLVMLRAMYFPRQCMQMVINRGGKMVKYTVMIVVQMVSYFLQ
jgi:hypothetical protein